MTDRKKITLPYLFQKVQEQAGVEMILVGDSLGMTMLGYDSTLPVKMDDMIRHASAMRRGVPTPFVVGDMPKKVF
jgi:3-methyl-2-oxobutanoate hydroxymethyltransferase